MSQANSPSALGSDLSVAKVHRRRSAPLATPSDLTLAGTQAITNTLNVLLADVFALYLKTKNFHWHLSGPHFRDQHRLLDEQGKALIAVTDPLAERCRMLGGSTLHSIAHIARLQRVLDNDAEFVEPQAMLAELREDNRALAAQMRSAHELCSYHRDVATADLLGRWLAEAELRTWFLFEASRDGGSTQRHVLVG